MVSTLVSDKHRQQMQLGQCKSAAGIENRPMLVGDKHCFHTGLPDANLYGVVWSRMEWRAWLCMAVHDWTESYKTIGGVHRFVIGCAPRAPIALTSEERGLRKWGQCLSATSIREGSPRQTYKSALWQTSTRCFFLEHVCQVGVAEPQPPCGALLVGDKHRDHFRSSNACR